MDDETTHQPTGKRAGIVHVTTNMNCTISLDGSEAGLTEDTIFTFQNVPFGRHLLEGATHRHFASKEIFLSLPTLNVRLVLEERGGTLTIESEIDDCRVGIEGKNYECPATVNDLKRGVHPISISGDGFQYTDRVRLHNNRATAYRITEELVREKELETAKHHYQHALEMPERTLGDQKRKISALDEILVKENRFDLTEGIETHRRLVQTIRQEEISRETISKAIQIEKARKQRKYGWILSLTVAVLILVIGIAVVLTRNHRNRKDAQLYQKAIQSNALVDYQNYVKLFGKNATHYLEAQSFLDRMERDHEQFNQARLQGTIHAYEKYLKEFGQSARYRETAESALRELMVKRDFPATLKKLNLISLSGGSFFMGVSPAEKGDNGDNQPPVWVKVSPFAIGQYEVTFDEYTVFCKNTRHPLPSDSRFGRGKRPVINVSWHDARSYCNWLSEKTGLIVYLPSEAEWEFACRSSRMSIFFWGNEMDNRYCVSGKKRRGRTRPVGSTKPNDLGLFDMSGNVHEWCSDHYQDPFSPGKGKKYLGSSYRFFQKYDKNKSENPVFNAWGNRRVIRGGSYRSSDFSCTSSHRSGALPETKRSDIGFRIAVTIPQ